MPRTASSNVSGSPVIPTPAEEPLSQEQQEAVADVMFMMSTMNKEDVLTHAEKRMMRSMTVMVETLLRETSPGNHTVAMATAPVEAFPEMEVTTLPKDAEGPEIKELYADDVAGSGKGVTAKKEQRGRKNAGASQSKRRKSTDLSPARSAAGSAKTGKRAESKGSKRLSGKASSGTKGSATSRPPAGSRSNSAISAAPKSASSRTSSVKAEKDGHKKAGSDINSLQKVADLAMQQHNDTVAGTVAPPISESEKRARTVTLLSLAHQLTEETLAIGIPSRTFFQTLANLGEYNQDDTKNEDDGAKQPIFSMPKSLEEPIEKYVEEVTMKSINNEVGCHGN